MKVKVKVKGEVCRIPKNGKTRRASRFEVQPTEHRYLAAAPRHLTAGAYILVTHDNSCAVGSSYPQSGYAPAAVTEDPGLNPTFGTYPAALKSSYGPEP